jgi:hypothetical protein
MIFTSPNEGFWRLSRAVRRDLLPSIAEVISTMVVKDDKEAFPNPVNVHRTGIPDRTYWAWHADNERDTTMTEVILKQPKVTDYVTPTRPKQKRVQREIKSSDHDHQGSLIRKICDVCTHRLTYVWLRAFPAKAS